MKDKIFYTISAFNLVAFACYLISFTSKKEMLQSGFEDKILKVRGIVVVDSLGIERVIVGAHLPEPNFATGYRSKGRGKSGSVSGVMLFDSEGQERGGYVTDDYYGNAFLTLDSKTSQQFLMIAEPQGDASLQLWNTDRKNKVSISVGDDGADIEIKKNNRAVKL